MPESTVQRALLMLLLAALFQPGHVAQAQSAPAEPVRALVVEVINNFCKLNITDTSGVQIGDVGTLHRLTAGSEAIGRVVITDVVKDYAVGKAIGAQPRLGDYTLITRREPPSDPSPSPEPAPAPAPAPAPPVAVVDRLDQVVGLSVDVEPKQGQPLKDVKLLRVVRDAKTGQARLLRVEQLDRRQRMLGIPAIKRVLRKGETVYAASGPNDQSAARPARRARLLTEARAQIVLASHQRWLARLEVHGIEPWPELSETEHRSTVAELKQLVEQIERRFPTVTLHETEHFLFCTNIPARQVGPYVRHLDAMHAMLAKMFRLPAKARVWRGKALVVAFAERAQFVAFEQEFMQHAPGPETYGLCHQKCEGEVIMACYRGERAGDFAHMLVHETSHGFLHRYKTPVRLPTWINEGLAEWIGQSLVPASSAVPNSRKLAHALLRETRSLDGLLSRQEGIATWQYGVASGLCDLMIRTDPQAFVQFIEGLKEGLTWQESLQRSYRCSPEQLVAAYGREIGVPDLRP